MPRPGSGARTEKFYLRDEPGVASGFVPGNCPPLRGSRRRAIPGTHRSLVDGKLSAGSRERELLYDLDIARQSLMRVTPKAEVTEKVDAVYANLVRMWAEP